MDWTGGVRRRFAPKRNNAILQKQKSYFAKARAALYNAPSQHPTSRTGPIPSKRQISNGSLSRQSPACSDSKRENKVPDTSRTSVGEAGNGKRRRGDAIRAKSSVHSLGKEKRRSPNIISIHSSIHSTPAPSPQSQQGDNSRRPPLHIMIPRHSMSEEENLLLANRRRLLSRSDWLGLAPTQPLRMKFSSSQDKDRIGKRRKVDRTRSKKGEAAVQRLMTPLFERPLQHQDHFMSGALPPDDFQVKIGTDAFASQTQNTRHSHTPGMMSRDQPSTEFGSLSEEPMLLGADGDSFDEFRAPSPPSPARSRPSGFQVQQVSAIANMIQPRDWDFASRCLEQRSHGDAKSDEEPEMGVANPGERRPTSIQESFEHLMPLDQRDHDGTEVHSRGPIDVGPARAATSTTGHMEDNEEMWRGFLEIYQRSNPSTAAVKSSSNHVTTSGSYPRPDFICQDDANEDDPPFSTPRGIGTQESAILDLRQRPNSCESTEMSRNSLSPSTSLKQITRLAKQGNSQRCQDEDDNNDLWRRFVCGSQDDSETSSQPQRAHPSDSDSIDDSLSLVPPAPSAIISGLGTSDMTTCGGDTRFIAADTASMSSENATTASKRGIRPSRTDAPAKTVMPTTTRGHEDDEHDIVDDEMLAVKVRPFGKVLAPKASTMNPKRLIPHLRQHQLPSKPIKTRPNSPPAKRKTLANDRTIYDLVDSDGSRLP